MARYVVIVNADREVHPNADGRWEHVQRPPGDTTPATDVGWWVADTGSDAIDQAAEYTGTSGDYVAFDLDDPAERRSLRVGYQVQDI